MKWLVFLSLLAVAAAIKTAQRPVPPPRPNAPPPRFTFSPAAPTHFTAVQHSVRVGSPVPSFANFPPSQNGFFAQATELSPSVALPPPEAQISLPGSEFQFDDNPISAKFEYSAPKSEYAPPVPPVEYGIPKQEYAPPPPPPAPLPVPEPVYDIPKTEYGPPPPEPPMQEYGPPAPHIPEPVYGAPKTEYGPPPPEPPVPAYGPPKQEYAPPPPPPAPIPLPEYAPPAPAPPAAYGPPATEYGQPGGHI